MEVEATDEQARALFGAYLAFLIRSLKQTSEDKSGEAWHLPPSLTEKTLTDFEFRPY